MTDQTCWTSEMDSVMSLPALRRAVLPHDVLEALRKEAGLRQGTIAMACGATDRTVRSWVTGQGIRPRNADRLTMLGEIVLVLSRTLRGDGIDQWLRARVRSLNGLRPAELLGNDEFGRVLAAAQGFVGGDYA